MDMSSKETYTREEISQILKIASEMDHLEDQEEGLTQAELKNLAAEVGIDPQNIETAIHQLREHQHIPPAPSFIEENFTYRNIQIADSLIDDQRWEELVTEIRRINGGIGKTSRLGQTYEWEQRKQNMGYLQVSVAPREDHSRIRINASYRAYDRVISLMGGMIGFTLLAVISDSIEFIQNGEFLFAGLGALGGWGAARFYLKSWMKRKRKMLNSLNHRLHEMLSRDTKPDREAEATRTGIDIDPESESKQESPTRNQRQHNR